MTSESQAVVLARLLAIDGTPADKVRVAAQRTRLNLWAWRLVVTGGLGFVVPVALVTLH